MLLPSPTDPPDRTTTRVRPAPVGCASRLTAVPATIAPITAGGATIAPITPCEATTGRIAAGGVTTGRITARVFTRLVAVGLLAGGLLAGCGTPPKPLPTAPPRASGSVGPSGSASPGGLVPSGPPTVAGGLPATVPGLPGGYTPPPGYPLPNPDPVPTAPITPPASPAPRCTGGPTAAQALAAVRDEPGLPPAADLRVGEGPFCAGGWQYFTIQLRSDADSDPLLVVTRGRPTALTVVEAGADVCSKRVQRDAPAGIRIRACGAG